MKFYLQQGHGMQQLDIEFVENNPDTGVILSPRNYRPDQIERHANELRERNASVLFDPQFYQPRTERENILNYPYWKGVEFATTDFATNGAEQLCEGVITYQIEVLQVSEVILPGRYSNSVTEDWLNIHYVFAETAESMNLDVPVYSTIALGPDVIMDRQSLDRLLNELVNYPVDGFYLVVKNPRNFLVTEEIFIYNLLDGLLSLVLSGKKILLGYSNQQGLIYASAGVTGLASGNFRNVRSFDPATFDVQNTSDRQRRVWYYDANTLSEFRPQSLGLAYQRGLSGSFGPVCQYCRPLLESTNPANVPWGEPLAFRHYLTEINRQWLSFSTIPPNQRIDHAINLVDAANQRLKNLSERGFRLGERSFIDAIEPTLNALTAFKADRQNDLELLRDMLLE